MDKYIMVNLNMFAATHSIVVCGPGDAVEYLTSQPIAHIPKFVAQYAHENDIYKIKLIGASKFAQLIEYEIQALEMTNYNENKIEIEVL